MLMTSASYSVLLSFFGSVHVGVHNTFPRMIYQSAWERTYFECVMLSLVLTALSWIRDMATGPVFSQLRCFTFMLPSQTVQIRGPWQCYQCFQQGPSLSELHNLLFTQSQQWPFSSSKFSYFVLCSNTFECLMIAQSQHFSVSVRFC